MNPDLQENAPPVRKDSAKVRAMILPFHYLPAVLWAISLIQLLGISSVILVRLSEGSRWQTVCRILFCTSLMLVGTTAIVTMLFSPELWLLSGITLSCMIVSALFEHQNPERASVW